MSLNWKGRSQNLNYNSYLKAKLKIPEDGTFAQVRPMPFKRQSPFMKRSIVELSLDFL